jgi:hypothetical protein
VQHPQYPVVRCEQGPVDMAAEDDGDEEGDDAAGDDVSPQVPEHP